MIAGGESRVEAAPDRPLPRVRADVVTVLVLAGLAAGTALRVWILLSSQGALDADEAVWGLMAMHVLHGQVPTFFWGQAYGGSGETLVTAALFWIFGRSTAALKTTPILFWAVATVLVWRVGRRTLGEPRARLAAALFWMWPVFFVWKSTRAHGFYGAGLVFGLWAMLAALRLRERPGGRDVASLGLALGLGFWTTPQVAILGLPAVLWLLWSRPTLLRSAPLAVSTFVLGSLPWWLYNLRHHWASLHTGKDEESKLGHLHNLVVATLPTALGLRLPFSLHWLPGAAVGAVAYAALLAGFAWLLLRRPPGLGLLLLSALVFPVLYTLSPYTWLNTEPRYLALVAPVIVLLAAYAARPGWRALAVFAAAAGLSVGGMAVMVRDDLAASHSSGVALPESFAPLLRALDAHGVRRVWATYWIAYRITFESDERIVAAEPGSTRFAIRDGRVVGIGQEAAHPAGNGRYGPYQLEVARSPDAAYVFTASGTFAPNAEPALRRAGYRLVRTGVFAVWLPPSS
jgi:4-amino-4-deoxy-L-arabinose transferase-like glycosyltransferase